MNTETQHLIACTVRYMGPTNHRGARVKLTLHRFGVSKILSYDYAARDAEETANRAFSAVGLVPHARACGADHSSILLFGFGDCDRLLAFFGKGKK